MSFYNNQSNYYVNFNSTLDAQGFSSAQSSYDNFHHPETRSELVNVRYSTLEPTAQEFHPLTQSTHCPNGAVRKEPQSNRNKYRDNGRSRSNKYGSGRTFNGYKNEFVNRNEAGSSNEEHTKILQDAASFLKNSNQSNQEKRSIISENSYSDNTYYSNKEKYSKENRYSHQGSANIDHNQDYQHRHSEFGNVDSNIQKLSSSENSRNFKSRNRNFRPNGRNYDRPNNFYKNERFSTYYDKSNRNNSERNYSHYDRKNNYYDRYNDSELANKSEGSAKDQYDNRNFEQVKEDGYTKNFAKPYENRNNGKYGDSKSQRDWRKTSSNAHKDKKDSARVKKFDAASQRERLEEMLNRRLLECLVCCEKIRNADKIWNCMQCYHILHLSCVIAWAKSSKVENGWRCPACQNVCTNVPKHYKCYCGKMVDPKYDPGVIPHGCGDICLRKGRNCDHKCTILCHPGPCPDCNIMVTKPCGCGSTQQIVKCSTDIELVCEAVCNKTLNCGVHKCEAICHPGNCTPCDQKILQECYCGKVGRKVLCTAEFKGSTRYACENICDQLLSCGNHRCKKICHDGPCETCTRDVSTVKTCPCGKTPIKEPRTTCLDPIPCCDKVCGKVLQCGQPSAPHKCKELCHEGECPPCPLTTVVRCRCGHMDKELRCQEVTTKADDARCEKKCTKKRMCGKHKCNQRCCIEIEHFCPLPCNHQLSCGQHRCERTCHSGRCPPCMETSFEELYCECGASVLYPPIPCGTKPPACNKPCSRQRPCGHGANHSCHTGPCPPCTVLCKRWCHGHHEQRSAIPCHQETFSCGLPCGKRMPCGRHRCNKPCHEGACPLPCKQPCSVPRSLCGHPCGKPCHDMPCPESSCKQNVPVTCVCGLQKGTRLCTDVTEEFRNIEMSQLKEKMGDLSKDQTVDISDIVSKSKKPSVLKILECTEECRVLERNRRLAIGLQIRNPDLSQKLTPKYTDFMRQWAKKDPHFCQRVHDKLTELVQLAKQSKQKSRSYSFESMNRDKRHFIHEYCEHFGVESAAYDMEPNRNIVATAIKDKSWLPSMSLLEVIQRENGQRKVPGPVSVLSRSTAKPETVSLKLPSQMQRPNAHVGEFIDYFDPPP